MDKKFEEKQEHKADDDVQPVLELVDRLVMQKGIDVEKTGINSMHVCTTASRKVNY